MFHVEQYVNKYLAMFPCLCDSVSMKNAMSMKNIERATEAMWQHSMHACQVAAPSVLLGNLCAASCLESVGMGMPEYLYRRLARAVNRERAERRLAYGSATV